MRRELSWGALPFWASVDHADKVLVVTPCGELDLATAPALEQTVADALADTESTGPIDAVVFDLGGLQFIDVAGARAIQRCEALSRAQGLEFAAANAGRQARFVLELCGLSRYVQPD
ncbi:MAG TPA: STAS domain-containing protein [Solirubrobacteraceae bacterium]|nr:STAS domain-containing protein [Solirubrobacteraceae bacterium]